VTMLSRKLFFKVYVQDWIDVRYHLMKISRPHFGGAGCQTQRYWLSRRLASQISRIPSLRKDDDIYERPDGLSVDEQKEWDAMMENPVVHDLFHGMGSSGRSEGERYATAPGTKIFETEALMSWSMTVCGLDLWCRGSLDSSGDCPDDENGVMACRSPGYTSDRAPGITN